jgi:hypothetical protein
MLEVEIIIYKKTYHKLCEYIGKLGLLACKLLQLYHHEVLEVKWTNTSYIIKVQDGFFEMIDDDIYFNDDRVDYPLLKEIITIMCSFSKKGLPIVPMYPKTSDDVINILNLSRYIQEKISKIDIY